MAVDGGQNSRFRLMASAVLDTNHGILEDNRLLLLPRRLLAAPQASSNVQHDMVAAIPNF